MKIKVQVKAFKNGKNYCAPQKKFSYIFGKKPKSQEKWLT